MTRTVTKRKRGRQIHLSPDDGAILSWPLRAGPVPGPGQEPGTPPGSPAWAEGTQSPEPSFAPSIREQGVSSLKQPDSLQHSDKGCRYPKPGLNLARSPFLMSPRGSLSTASAGETLCTPVANSVFGAVTVRNPGSGTYKTEWAKHS